MANSAGQYGDVARPEMASFAIDVESYLTREDHSQLLFRVFMERKDGPRFIPIADKRLMIAIHYPSGYAWQDCFRLKIGPRPDGDPEDAIGQSSTQADRSPAMSSSSGTVAAPRPQKNQHSAERSTRSESTRK